ncbi:HNH endonuclease [Psychromonas ossibalaenae]|uniref:HNH endonuclease n=1 Tax=Psychromonas ossibalaenae TaxID=444922 RepID=UPI00037276FC|nr:HNH endonuclease [Psychromonas ossibalaenae]
MFNVTRPEAVPASLARKIYNHADVVNILKPMFHGKCYLCERDEIQDVEVEHFKPHMSIEADKFDWDNLFYSCSRCNSIKSSTHVGLLNCTDNSINVFREITLRMSPAIDDDVIVEANNPNPSAETSRTVNLLKLCYNSTNTALRGVSRESLIEQMYDYMVTFVTARSLLKKPSTGKTIKNGAKEVIEAMLDVKHPFSAFWRWQYLHDSFLNQAYPELENGF